MLGAGTHGRNRKFRLGILHAYVRKQQEIFKKQYKHTGY